ncbi:hypothetical protein CCACVL1_00880, partial [Corchorus capsularis]
MGSESVPGKLSLRLFLTIISYMMLEMKPVDSNHWTE